MSKRKFKKGSFVLITECNSFIQNHIGLVVGYKGNKVIVYIMDVNLTVELDEVYLRRV